mmetsp:Transcript_35515/g.47674  ORF Transcript_35515/g.47674 Transcript_35515/m.47674 type:complete len:255 (+) Transcript_35515:64-828(+)
MTTSSAETAPDTSDDVIWTVLVPIGSGIASFVGLFLMMKVLMYISHRYCPTYSDVDVDSADELIAVRKQKLDKVLITKIYTKTCDSSSDSAESIDDAKEAVGNENPEEDAEKGEMSAVASNNSYNENICAICICDFEEGDIVTHGVNCGHVFHKECVLEWLGKHNECPTCRRDMIRADKMTNAEKSTLSKERDDETASDSSDDLHALEQGDIERIDSDVNMAEMGQVSENSGGQQMVTFENESALQIDVTVAAE